MAMDANCFLNNLTDVELLARMIYGEARGEPYDGMVAVACVAMNRAAQPTWWGTTLREVLLHPSQFSCFLPAYVSRLITPSEPVWLDCIKIAHGVMTNQTGDPTFGATSYYADYIAAPGWASQMQETVKIGQHVFLR